MEFSCPIPNYHHDKIILSHGSGGLLSNQLIKSCIISLFDDPILNLEDDAAILKSSQQIVFSTDSYVVSPIFFPGGNIGDLAINGTVNDIAVCGGIPEYISLSFILEEGLTILDFWEVLKSIKQCADKAGVRIVTGDTKVVEKGKGDKIFINTSGIGNLHPWARWGIEHIQEGDSLILSGPLASHGVAILALRNNLEFVHDILSDTKPLNHITHDLLNEFGDNIHFMRDATRGGAATILNEIASSSNKGIVIQEDQIPIEPAVNDLCEILGLDPLSVANEGAMIMVCDKSVSKEMVKFMKDKLNLPEANIFGEVVTDTGAKVVLQNSFGGKRIVQMPIGEQLPRIC